MASWSEIQAQAPQLAASAREFLDAFAHKALATLRRDGSPRISGSEVIFAEQNLDAELRKRVLVGKGGPGPSHLFRCDVSELVVVSLPDPPAFLVIESWHEGRGVTRVERRNSWNAEQLCRWRHAVGHVDHLRGGPHDRPRLRLRGRPDRSGEQPVTDADPRGRPVASRGQRPAIASRRSTSARTVLRLRLADSYRRTTASVAASAVASCAVTSLAVSLL